MGHKFKAVEQFRDKSSSQRVSRRIGRFLILLDMCLQSKITSTHCKLCPLNIYITKLGQFNFFFIYKNIFIRMSRLRFGLNLKNILMLKSVLVLKVEY